MAASDSPVEEPSKSQLAARELLRVLGITPSGNALIYVTATSPDGMVSYAINA